MELNNKDLIAKRVAQELRDGDVINLGIGIPTLVADYVTPNIFVTFQAEDGILGVGSAPESGQEDKDIFNASGMPVTVNPGGSFFDTAASFAMIRGGHVDMTVLGALQVDEKGNIANWMVPGKKPIGMGGAMDLVVGARKVVVAMEHTNNGKHKIVKDCSFPLTAVGVVKAIFTEMGVIDVSEKGLVLREIAAGLTVDDVQAATGAPLIISPDLKVMNP
jgi:acetate CoA/acetoacetate CoA-transferase beta subunit